MNSGGEGGKRMEEEENTMEENLKKKHQMMLERLSARHQTRLDTPKPSSSSSSTTTTSAFLSRFNHSKNSIAAQIDSTVDPSLLPHISAAISDLDKLVAENSYLLPSYEIRSSLKTISDLKQRLDDLSTRLIPKKKFSFKNKPPTRTTHHNNTPQTDATEKTTTTPTYPIRDSPGFRHEQNQVLVQDFKGAEIGEFTVSDLDSCVVKLVGCVSALFVNRLKKCRVYAGPVVGSVLIEQVEDCVFVLASHQIRIHFAKRTDFYLRVRSRPIIEDSDGLRFAPYCLNYEGIDEDLASAGLDEETGNWANVDDFKWLRAVQSPNWAALPEEERLGVVDFADSGCGNGTT